MAKTAIIVGSKGQDGVLLTDFLLKKSYILLGISRNEVQIFQNTDNQHHLAITVNNLVDVGKVFQMANEIHEVYFLAAYHHSSQEKVIDETELMQKSYEVHVQFLQFFLETIRQDSPKTKLFYAASSLIFGDCEDELQDENTPFRPNEIYGITKVAGLQLCRYYAKKHNLFACAGILYNHESALRKDIFLSKKIIQSVVKIKKGLQENLVIGSLESVVDWGYAPDFVDAFWRVLQLESPQDFVIATGQKHSVRDFVEIAFECVGLDWQSYVIMDQNMIVRKSQVRIGNFAKLNQFTEWKPTISFEEMVELLVNEEKKYEK